jgi:hypothetical protein
VHSATPATGRPTQPPGKTVAKNRPAPLFAHLAPRTTPRSRRPTAPPKPQQPSSAVGAAEISPARKGGEEAPSNTRDNLCGSWLQPRHNKTVRSTKPIAVPFPRSFPVAVIAPVRDRARSPRPRSQRHAARLCTHPAHSPRAPHSQQNRTSHCYIGVSPHTNLPRRQAGHESQFMNRAVSNRHTSRLEVYVCRTKQTLDTHSNRQFFTFLARNFALAHRAPRTPLQFLIDNGRY